MEITVWRVVRALVGAERGRDCRCCGVSIEGRDRFGMSEAICRACRRWAGP